MIMCCLFLFFFFAFSVSQLFVSINLDFYLVNVYRIIFLVMPSGKNENVIKFLDKSSESKSIATSELYDSADYYFLDYDDNEKRI